MTSTNVEVKGISVAVSINSGRLEALVEATDALVDARADLYALGCVLHALLTGQPPFTGEDPMAVLYQHLHQPPQPLRDIRPDIPVDLERLVLGLLAKNPPRRPRAREPWPTCRGSSPGSSSAAHPARWPAVDCVKPGVQAPPRRRPHAGRYCFGDSGNNGKPEP